VADDVPAVDAVVVESFTPYIERIGVEPMPMLFDYAALVAAGLVWVATDAQGLCGVLVLSAADDHVMLDVIAVADRVRGRGVGNVLMRFTERHTEGAGRAEVRLYTHALMVENRAYYARHGYREVDLEEVDEHRVRVVFSKRLGSR
jgi:GNAT superfamily N-acetyltransferase